MTIWISTATTHAVAAKSINVSMTHPSTCLVKERPLLPNLDPRLGWKVVELMACGEIVVG